MTRPVWHHFARFKHQAGQGPDLIAPFSQGCQEVIVQIVVHVLGFARVEQFGWAFNAKLEA